MKTDSMKNFSKDLFKILASTLDGLVASLIMATFLGRAAYQYFYQGGSQSKLAEGFLFSLITLLMLIRLRHDASADVRIHYGALASVVAFAICILLLR